MCSQASDSNCANAPFPLHRNQLSLSAQSHQTWTEKNSFKSGLRWRQTASQPAAVEVVVSGLHCPSPFSPSALLLRQNQFQAALLCSKRSALCAMGEGSSAGRETAVTVTSTAARTPFWKGYVVTDIPISTWLECIIILCVQCVQCFLLNCQTNKLSASHMDDRGRKSGLFFLSWRR